MFHFLRRSAHAHPSSAVVQAIRAEQPQLTESALLALTMITEKGKYAGRKVRYFRVIAARPVVDGRTTTGAEYRYDELDTRPELILYAGFVEQDGTVVLSGGGLQAETLGSPRELADRADHGDDEGVVFPESRTNN